MVNYRIYRITINVFGIYVKGSHIQGIWNLRSMIYPNTVILYFEIMYTLLCLYILLQNICKCLCFMCFIMVIESIHFLY